MFKSKNKEFFDRVKIVEFLSGVNKQFECLYCYRELRLVRGVNTDRDKHETEWVGHRVPGGPTL